MAARLDCKTRQQTPVLPSPGQGGAPFTSPSAVTEMPLLQPLFLRSQAPRLVARPDVDVVRPPRAARRDADEPQLRVDVF